MVSKVKHSRPLRLIAAVAALIATFALAGGELTSHRHGLDETDLVSHAIAEPAAPHPNSPHQPHHLEAAREAEHEACVDCLLQALAPALASAGAALSVPLPRLVAPAATAASIRHTELVEAASPRGPPSAA